MHDTYRIRIGEVRIEYEVDWESKRIGVLAVEFRGTDKLVSIPEK